MLEKMTSTYRNQILVVAVTAFCLLIFSAKPFHIDDPLFIWSAKHIQQHPTDFYGFNVNWYGFEAPMYSIMKNPPAACYFIALVGSIFGYSETALHIAFLFPALVAGLGFYYLANRFCSQPVLAALTAILSPGFLVSSTNVMCDTMMLAFWIWTIYCWMRGLEDNKLGWLAGWGGCTNHLGRVD